MAANVWLDVLERLRGALEPEEFRRWFSATAYAGDSGDHITVWVDSESVRRHIQLHYQAQLDRALEALQRRNVAVRFVVAGYGEDEEE